MQSLGGQLVPYNQWDLCVLLHLYLLLYLQGPYNLWGLSFLVP